MCVFSFFCFSCVELMSFRVSMEEMRDYIELIWMCSSLSDAVGTGYMSTIRLHLYAEGPHITGPDQLTTPAHASVMIYE